MSVSFSPDLCKDLLLFETSVHTFFTKMFSVIKDNGKQCETILLKHPKCGKQSKNTNYFK